MVDFSKVTGQTNSYPPIVLQLNDNKPNNMPKLANFNYNDSFDKKKEHKRGVFIDLMTSLKWQTDRQKSLRIKH